MPWPLACGPFPHLLGPTKKTKNLKSQLNIIYTEKRKKQKGEKHFSTKELG